MPTTVRLLLVGIAFAYLICIAAQFMSPNPGLASSQALGFLVILFVVATVTLHLSLAISMRSWTATILSVASVAILAILFLRGLMKLTGDFL